MTIPTKLAKCDYKCVGRSNVYELEMAVMFMLGVPMHACVHLYVLSVCAAHLVVLIITVLLFF